MMAVKRLVSGYRLLAALALILSGLGVAAVAAPAVAATAPGHTIASAGTLGGSDAAAGGGGAIDFWNIHLNGGDVVQFEATTSTNGNFSFQLYAPGTTDANFPSATSFASYSTEGNEKTVFTLQAPYNGTFVLAVCEDTGGDCPSVDSGNGSNPMDAYTFTTSLATSVSGKVAAAEVRASSTIARAPALGLGHFEAGGAGPIDFWKVRLNGGDAVRFETTTSTNGNFSFQLYAPSTDDGNFPAATTFATYSTEGDQKTVYTLQAPYNGTFLLAVCEDTGGDCPSVDSGNGSNPMDPYTFTTSLATSVSPGVAAKETRAATTIARAPVIGLGHYEAGGGNAIDFWKVHLYGGDRVQFEATTSTEGNFSFELFGPKVNDGNFPAATWVSSNDTEGLQKSVFTLQAPFTGTFTLGVCEDTGGDCPSVDSGNGSNPMDPYTFTTRLSGGFETRTALKLTAKSVRYGHEKGFRFTVHVVTVFNRGRPGGKVVIFAGRRALCTAKVVNGNGFCALPVNTKLPVGAYVITGAYAGNRDPSRSGGYTLKVTR
jgi:hypothetical protein